MWWKLTAASNETSILRYCSWHWVSLRKMSKLNCFFCGRRSTLDVSHCVLFANRIVMAASRAHNVQDLMTSWECYYPRQAQDLVKTIGSGNPCAWPASIRYFTPHSDTPQSTFQYISHLYLPHSTLYTWLSALHTHTLHFTPLYTSRFTLYTPDSGLYTSPSTLSTLHSTH